MERRFVKLWNSRSTVDLPSDSGIGYIDPFGSLDAKAFREVIALAGAKAARRDANSISALEQAARALCVRMRRSTEGRIPTALSP